MDPPAPVAAGSIRAPARRPGQIWIDSRLGAARAGQRHGTAND